MYNMYHSIPVHTAAYTYTGDSAPTDSHHFICEYHTLTDLLDGMKTPCACGMSTHPWIIDFLYTGTCTCVICVRDLPTLL